MNGESTTCALSPRDAAVGHRGTGRTIDFALRQPAFPLVGEQFGPFRLLAELGRGAAGRVFLAAQSGAAGRPVVLKVTPRHDREPLSLGRLQHTHIIPLYAIHEFPELGLQALCQPYLGGASLAQILSELRDVPVENRTGASLMQACDRAASSPPFAEPQKASPRQLLAKSSYVEAMCWIGACLADALEHAHERGLVHFDLKPSNVLLAADGQPLLLDFHLALSPLTPGQPVPPGFGGTRSSMSPEQDEAFRSARRGLPSPTAVGPRSDIYSLGRLLYVALGGNDEPLLGEPRSLRTKNRHVSPGLDAIVRKCLKSRPEDRYPTARALAGDLRRHLADEPLQGVVNRSAGERWQKWRRRNPLAPLWMALICSLIALPFFLVGLWTDRVADARESLEQGQELFRRRHFADAVAALDRGRKSLDSVPGFEQLRGQLDQSRRSANRAAAADHLHAVADQMRFMIGSEFQTLSDLQTLDQHWSRVWQSRNVLGDASAAPLEANLEEQIRDDLADVADLRGDLDRRLTVGGRHASDSASRAVAVSAAPSARWSKHLAAGRNFLKRQEFNLAAEEFAKAAELRPANFWAHFFSGVCSHRQGRHADAVKDFTIALALSPDSAEVYYNRGLSRTALKSYSAAIRDFDRALAINPKLAAAALGRGMAHFHDRQPAQAFADFRLALQHGIDANRP